MRAGPAAAAAPAPLPQVGLNSHRVLHHREWRRLGSSVLLHGDLPHLVSNCTSLVLEGLPLERRLGSVKLLALVASTGLATQGLYCEWGSRRGGRAVMCADVLIVCASRADRRRSGVGI